MSVEDKKRLFSQTILKEVLKLEPGRRVIKIYSILKEQPEKGKALAQLMFENFDDIIMGEHPELRVGFIIKVAEYLPEQQEMLLNLAIERFDDFIKGVSISELRVSTIIKLAEALPNHKDRILNIGIEYFAHHITRDEITPSKKAFLITHLVLQIGRASPNQQEALLRLIADHFINFCAAYLRVCSKVLPDYHDILQLPEDKIIPAIKNHLKEKNKAKIDEVAKFLAEENSYKKGADFCLFRNLMPDVKVKIAALVGDPRDHNEQESVEIARQYLGSA